MGGNTICYGQELARKSHQDSAIRFVTAKSWPEKRPARLGSTICYGQELARKSHQDSAVRFVTVFRGPERATKTRQYGLLRPNVGQREPTRLGSTICYGQTWARKKPPRLGSTMCFGQERVRKSHQDSAIRFVTAKSWPEKATNTLQYDLLRPTARATMTRQYDLSRPNVGQKKPPRFGSTICYGQELARKSQRDSAVRFVTAKSWPERATKTRQYDLLQPPPPRLGSAICYGQTWARKAHQDSAIRFVTAKRGPEKATRTRQYDLLRPRVGQKEPPRLGSTICYGQELARKKASETRQYDLLRPRVGQKEPPRLGSAICYGQTWARKSHQNSAVRFVTAKSRPNVGQKEPPKFGSTMRYDQTWARKSHQDSAVRFVTAKSWPQKATKTRQYDLLQPRVGQKKPPRLGNTICYGQELARKSHQDSAVRFVTAKRGPERAFKTRQYDLLRPRVG